MEQSKTGHQEMTDEAVLEPRPPVATNKSLSRHLQPQISIPIGMDQMSFDTMSFEKIFLQKLMYETNELDAVIKDYEESHQLSALLECKDGVRDEDVAGCNENGSIDFAELDEMLSILNYDDMWFFITCGVQF